MQLGIGDRVGVDVEPAVDLLDEFLLRPEVGSSYPVGVAVLIGPACDDEPPDVVAVTLRVREPFQHHGTGSFARNESIGILRESGAPPGGRQHPRVMHLFVRLSGEVGGRSARQRQVDLAGA